MNDITFSKDIRKIMDKVYLKEVQKLEKSIDNLAENILVSLKRNSPKRTGKYAKSWRIKQRSRTRIIHNLEYRLTHLLEDGYINVAGRYVSARRHMKKSFDENIPKFIHDLKK